MARTREIQCGLFHTAYVHYNSGLSGDVEIFIKPDKNNKVQTECAGPVTLNARTFLRGEFDVRLFDDLFQQYMPRIVAEFVFGYFCSRLISSIEDLELAP